MGETMDLNYELSSRVIMKKQHPCGSYEWEIIRMGADIKIKCMGCSRIVMMPRSKFEKGLKKLVKTDEMS